MMTTTTTKAIPSFRFLNDASRPPHERADAHPLWTAEGAVCWMRRTNERGDMCFDLFESLEQAARYALVQRPQRERCYYAMVRPERPLEWYIDAEIKRDQCASLATPVEPLRQDFTTLMYVGLSWVRASFEAMFGVGVGADTMTWLLRADTPAKLSCHMHTPQWVFSCIEDMATAMRTVEDVLYAQYAGVPISHPLARMLFYHFADRKHRRRPGCITRPSVVVPDTLECVLDMGVYTTVRHMRMATQSTKPGSNNALKLFQPSSIAVRLDDASVSPMLMANADVVGETMMPSISGGDLLLTTMIATERAKRRVPMPTLCQAAGHHELMRAQCMLVVAAMERYVPVMDNANSEGRVDPAALFLGSLYAAFSAWIDGLLGVYLPRQPQRAPLGSVADSVATVFAEFVHTTLVPLAHEHYHYRGGAAERQSALECVATATYRSVWYMMLLVRWHLQPRTLDNDTWPASVATVMPLLERVIPSIFATNLLNSTLAEATAMGEVETLVEALFGIQFASDDDDAEAMPPSLGASNLCLNPLDIFTMAVCSVRLELIEHYLFSSSSPSPPSSASYRAIDNHKQYEVVWSLECFRNNTLPPPPRSVLYRGMRRGSIWQPHIDMMVHLLQRSNVESTTRFADIAVAAATGSGGIVKKPSANVSRGVALLEGVMPSRLLEGQGEQQQQQQPLVATSSTLPTLGGVTKIENAPPPARTISSPQEEKISHTFFSTTSASLLANTSTLLQEFEPVPPSLSTTLQPEGH